MFFCFNEDVFKEEDVFFLIITKLVLNLLSLLLFVGNVFQEMFDDSFFMCIIINFTCDPLIFTFLCFLDEAFNDAYVWIIANFALVLAFLIYLDDAYVWSITKFALVVTSCFTSMEPLMMPIFGPLPSLYLKSIFLLCSQSNLDQCLFSL